MERTNGRSKTVWMKRRRFRKRNRHRKRRKTRKRFETMCWRKKKRGRIVAKEKAQT